MECFIDCHAHLFMYDSEKIKKIIENAKKDNVKIIINNGIDINSNREILKIKLQYKEIKAALGLYPIEAIKLNNEKINSEIDFIKKNKEKIYAIGEIGLDLKWTKKIEKQAEVFKKFINLAIELNKPMIVHSRLAEKQAINILEKKQAKIVIMHFFSGNKKLAEKCIKNKWYFSIPTSVCYNQQMQEMVKLIPIEQMFCETDSPYLHPIKGKQNNEPSNVIESYKTISKIKKIKLKDLKRQIYNNYFKIFE